MRFDLPDCDIFTTNKSEQMLQEGYKLIYLIIIFFFLFNKICEQRRSN